MLASATENTIHHINPAPKNAQDSNGGSGAPRDNVTFLNKINRAGRKVKDFVHTANDNITETTDKVTTQIRTKPVQSSLIALGVGFVVGMLIRR